MSTTGYVYVLTNPCIVLRDADGKCLSPVKIGSTKSMEYRLGTLDTSVPIDFVVYCTFQCESECDAKELENRVHKRLDAQRVFARFGKYKLGNPHDLSWSSTEFFKVAEQGIVKSVVREVRLAALEKPMIKYEYSRRQYPGRSASAIRSNAGKELHCIGSGADVYGDMHKDDDGITVKRGKVGKVKDHFRIYLQKYFDKRMSLENDGSIVDGEIKEKCEFDSLSEAASVCMGRSANGNKECVLTV